MQITLVVMIITGINAVANGYTYKASVVRNWGSCLNGSAKVCDGGWATFETRFYSIGYWNVVILFDISCEKG